MRKMRKKLWKKGLVLGAGVLMILVTLQPAVLPISRKQLNKAVTKVDTEDENEVFVVAIGPVLAASIDECKVITNLSESDALELKERLLDVEEIDNLPSEEIMKKKLEVLRKYQILPPEFTAENITKILGGISGKSKKTSPLTGFPRLKFGKTYTSLGPHFILYGAVAGQAVDFHIGRDIPIAGDITRLIDILNISDPNVEELLKTIWVFYYLHYTDCLILFGGPLGIYVSIGVFPGSEATFAFAGPFFGIYAVYVGAGIYIFDRRGVEKPLLDIIFGFTSVLSIVQYIEPGDGEDYNI